MVLTPEFVATMLVVCKVALMKGRSHGGAEQRNPYSPHFITALHEFEDRVCAALGVVVGSTKAGAGNGYRMGQTAASAATGAGGWLLDR